MQWYMDHVCTHVSHLDLVDIDQNMFTTVRLMVTRDLIKKIQIPQCYGPKTQKYSKMCPVSILVKKFSFWHYIPIDNHWTDHSYQFWPPNPYMRHAVAHERQATCSRFTRKLLITKLFERCLLVATEVPYKSQLTLDPCHWPFML